MVVFQFLTCHPALRLQQPVLVEPGPQLAGLLPHLAILQLQGSLVQYVLVVRVRYLAEPVWWREQSIIGVHYINVRDHACGGESN